MLKLQSLPPEKIFTVLDLARPGLERVAAASAGGDRPAALEALLAYYRQRHSAPGPAPAAAGTMAAADRLVRHVFQWGPYAPAGYGPAINWAWDPRGDIEWVAAVYRFYWAAPLAAAFRATGREQYARTFVELVSDWIARHPLEEHEKTHPVYRHWRGFAWLDIQTGIRSGNLAAAFPVMVHARAFTPAFLGLFLASLHDHQRKTECLPMGRVHNKAIFEQRGFVGIAAAFPEFREAPAWLRLGLARSRESLLAQVTADGVQREWSFGYHLGVLRDAQEIACLAENAGLAVPGDYRRRIWRMYDYIFWAAGPDLGAPMFGDAARPARRAGDRSRWQLHDVLCRGAAEFGEPRWKARAVHDPVRLPAAGSRAFPEAGLYVFRDGWGPRAIHLALHCSPPAISSHDQPDNGTFELCAFGRWLMPDSGFYTYGHDPDARDWHRRTAVHQALTLDGADAAVAGRHLLWHAGGGLDALTVENDSRPGLTHRRTVWFVERRFFVILDEALGTAPGTLRFHFQFAPGPAELDRAARRARTLFSRGNVVVAAFPPAEMLLEEEVGWTAWAYGRRRRRPAFAFRARRGTPGAFLFLVVPCRGTTPPALGAEISAGWRPGAPRVSVRAAVSGRRWTLGRDLETLSAWSVPETGR